MSYKYSTGSVYKGDIYYENDAERNTYIDFDEDYIALKTGGIPTLVVSGSAVGIGTADPDNTLHVLSAGSTHIKVESEAGYLAALRIKAGGQTSAYVWAPADTADLRFYVNGADRMHLDNDGRVGIATSSPNSGLHIENSVAFAARAITQNHTVTATDHTIFVNASSTNITVTLPTAANILGRQYTVKRVDSAGTSVTIATNGSETIEGASSMTLPGQRAIAIQSDNNNWWIMAEYIAPP